MKPTTVHVVVPMAGHGSRFAAKGYKDPKPFIPVFDRPMIEWVIETMLPRDGYPVRPVFHFVAQAAHLAKYSLENICQRHGIEYTVQTVESVTQGAPCTVLLAKQYINNDEPLVTVNSDQFIDWDPNAFYARLLDPALDGCINVFPQPNPADAKWSFANVGPDGFVTEVAEKRWIGPLATTGVYGWKRGADFVRLAEQMIAAEDRVNGEFYCCPVYGYLLREGGRVGTIGCRKLWGLGIPEDLERFLADYRPKLGD
jgi:dTDP-glucose pyrophosphorylase